MEISICCYTGVLGRNRIKVGRIGKGRRKDGVEQIGIFFFLREREKGTIINKEKKKVKTNQMQEGSSNYPKIKSQMCPDLPNSESDIPEHKIPISV